MNASTVAVKICGLTQQIDAAHAEESGATYLGVILAGGPRLVSPERARAILGPRRHDIRRVAVFGSQAAGEIVTQAADIDLDIVQLHGAADVDTIRFIQRESAREVWPVVRVAGTSLPPETELLAHEAGTLVLDAFVVGQLGGTGVALDWSGLVDSLGSLRAQLPSLRIVLAGGLRPSNVSEAIRLLSPSVVDVSSGVESAPGVKDPALIQQFVRAAQAATEMLR